MIPKHTVASFLIWALALLVPPLASANDRTHSDVVIVLDVSRSLSTSQLEQTAGKLGESLSELAPRIRVGILTFSDDVRWIHAVDDPVGGGRDASTSTMAESTARTASPTFVPMHRASVCSHKSPQISVELAGFSKRISPATGLAFDTLKPSSGRFSPGKRGPLCPSQGVAEHRRRRSGGRDRPARAATTVDLGG